MKIMLLKYISDYFSVLPNQQGIRGGTYTVEPAQNGEKFFEIRRNNESQIVAGVITLQLMQTKDYAAIEALGEIRLLQILLVICIKF